MRAVSLSVLSLASLASIAFACSVTVKPSGFENGEGSDGGPSTTRTDGGSVPILTGDGSTSQMDCVPSPSNYDIPSNGCDDDANGTVDDVSACDTSLKVDGPAADFVKALGLCQTTTAADAKWGVVSATYQKGFKSTSAATAGQHGILAKFGDAVKPREGKSFGVLSSGWAREYDGDTSTSCDTNTFDGCFKQGQGMGGGDADVPSGYPKPASGCPQNTDTHDIIDLKLEIKVPTNAQGFQFDFDFWSGEWPEYVCTPYNDAFIAYLQSQAGTPDNISFDSKGNPVSVNNGFFDRCTPNVPTGCAGGGVMKTSQCPSGTGELNGTGFLAMGPWCSTDPFNPQMMSGGGATGWLTTTAPVKPGETITLHYMIWDTHDTAYDSSVILDNFQWVPGPVTTGTQRPPR